TLGRPASAAPGSASAPGLLNGNVRLLRPPGNAGFAGAADEDGEPGDHRGRSAPGGAAVLPEQGPLRRPGRLRPASEPRTGRPRPHGRGVLRPALSRPGSGADPVPGPQPGPVPGRGPVPDPAP